MTICKAVKNTEPFSIHCLSSNSSPWISFNSPSVPFQPFSAPFLLSFDFVSVFFQCLSALFSLSLPANSEAVTTPCACRRECWTPHCLPVLNILFYISAFHCHRDHPPLRIPPGQIHIRSSPEL